MNNREILYFVGCSLAAIGLIFGTAYMSLRHDRALRHAREQFCIDLNPKYGKLYTTTEGPYAGVKMKAVRFGRETISLSVDEGDPLVFRCAEVEEVKP